MLVSQQGLASVIAEISAAKSVGLDTETTGLSEDDRMFSLIIAIPGDRQFYFNFQKYDDIDPNCILDKSAVIAALYFPLWSDCGSEIFIHNAKFDMRMLANEGVSLQGVVHCTYAAERVIRNNYLDSKEPYSLDACARRRGWAKDDKVKEYADKNGLFTLVRVPGKKTPKKHYHFEKVPWQIMVPYGCHDAKLHLDIGLDQKRRLWEMQQEATAKNFPSVYTVADNEALFTKTLYRMERRGVLIDKEYTEKALAYELDIIQAKKIEFERATGEPYVDSRVTFTKVFDRLGEKYPLTEKGNPSFAADVLEEMTTPVASMINEIRGREKKAGTYYSSFLYYADHQGVVHADARQAGTESGRCSYRDPNLQNVPKEDEEPEISQPYLVRGCFVPRPGHFFYSIDYKQMEYRMMMDFAGENRIIKLILEGVDFHDAIAQEVGVTRKQAKTLNFALSYGAGPKKIGVMLGVPLSEAKDLVMTYWGRLPRLKQFFNAVQNAGKARGYIFNWAGRRNYLYDFRFAYVLPNHHVQGGCADVVKIAMNRIDAKLQEMRVGTQMLLQVHDELLLEVPFGEEEIHRPIQEIMESVYRPQNGMILHTSLEHSLRSWGANHKVKGAFDGVQIQNHAASSSHLL